jgi:hypothetical protein
MLIHKRPSAQCDVESEDASVIIDLLHRLEFINRRLRLIGSMVLATTLTNVCILVVGATGGTARANSHWRGSSATASPFWLVGNAVAFGLKCSVASCRPTLEE